MSKELEQEFVTHEQSVAIKELGFNEPCFSAWWKRTEKHKEELEYNYQSKYRTSGAAKDIDRKILRPHYQQAFRWFRKNYGLWNQITKDGTASYNIVYSIWDYNGLKSFKFESKEQSYEEAELACLDKMIEIVQEKNKNKK